MILNKFTAGRKPLGLLSKQKFILGFLAICLCTGVAIAAPGSGPTIPPEDEPNDTSTGGEPTRPLASPPPAPTFKDGVIQGDVSAVRQAISEAESVGMHSSAFATVRVIVTLRPQSAGESVTARLARVPLLEGAVAGTNSRITHEWQHVPAVVMELDTAGLDALVQLDTVGGIELDRDLEADLTSSRAVTGVDLINAQGHEGGGTFVTDPWEVVIIDSAVRSSHYSLQNKVVSEACYTTDASCPNGANSMTGTGAGAPCAFAGCFHGTHVAGIAAGGAALHGAASQPGGNAREANIVAINVFQWNPATSDITAKSSSIISALDRVYNLEAVQGRRIAAVNLSLGGGSYTSVCDTASPATTAAMSLLRSAGVLVIASAGNDYTTNGQGWPGCISYAISVGNTQDNDSVAASSSVSPVTDLWAPGEDITAPGSGADDEYITIGGTSMSAPQVAGAAAILYNCQKWDSPNIPADPLDDDWVISHIIDNGPLVTDNRAGGTKTMPRLDLYAAANQYNLNNTFASAEALSGTSGSKDDYTHCGTLEAGETTPVGSNVASTWFTFTAPADGDVLLSTCDAYTTVQSFIGVFSGSSVSSLTQLSYEEGDPSCPHAVGSATLTQPVTAGQELKIAVYAMYSFGSAGHGKFRLNYDFTPTVLPPSMSLPVPGSTLLSSTVYFDWDDNGVSADYWALWAGSTPTGKNYFDSGTLTASPTSFSGSGLPTDGSTVHVTLFYYKGGAWQPHIGYTYTAAANAEPSMTSPVPGSTLTSSDVNFVWNGNGSTVLSWSLKVGSSPGSQDHFYSGAMTTQTNVLATGLPTDGSTVYVTFSYLLSGATAGQSNAYTYTAVTAPPPSMTSPVPGSTLTSSNVDFDWDDNGTSVELWVMQGGAAPLGYEYFYSGHLPNTQTNYSASGIPQDGSTVHVTLSYRIDGVWQTIAYTYIADTALPPPAITSPVPLSTLAGSSVVFQWDDNGNNIGNWELEIGSTVGGNNHYSSGPLGGVSSHTVSGLPTDSSQLFVRLWSFNESTSTWVTRDYTYTAAPPPTALMCNGLAVTVDLNNGDLPTNGNDVIWGTPGPDTIDALDGDDTICAEAGADTVYGGRGNDTIYGGLGADEVFAGTGLDKVYGNEDGDILWGQGGADLLNGGSGIDYIYGGSGVDTINGGPDGDFLFGYGSGDIINGNAGDNQVNGGPGPDSLKGGGGNDTIRGQGGKDTIDGQGGDDTITGGSGPDAISGGAGVDSCNGQAGTDTEAGCEVSSNFPIQPAGVVLAPNSAITAVADVDAIDLCDDLIEECLAQ